MSTTKKINTKPQVNALNVKVPSKYKGFTMLELLVALGILGILLAVSMPSLQATLSNMSTNSASKSVVDSLNNARGEAIRRGLSISLCGSADGLGCDNDSWSTGWIMFVDASPVGAFNAGEEIVQVYEPLADVNLTSSVNLISFDGRGFGLNTAIQTFTFCPEDNNADYARAIEVGISGRARIIETGLACP